MFDHIINLLNPITFLAILTGMLTIISMLFSKWSLERAQKSNVSNKMKEIKYISELLSTVSYAVLKPMIVYFSCAFIGLLFAIWVLNAFKIVNFPLNLIFITGCGFGFISMVSVVLLCTSCCLNGNQATVLAAHGSNGIKDGFLAVNKNSAPTALFMSTIMLMFLGILYYMIDLANSLAIAKMIDGVLLSSIFFGYLARFCGGVFTKAADVGADLSGKLFADVGEDSPKNPAVVADAVGDVVGDCAGSGNVLMMTYFISVKLLSTTVYFTKINLLFCASVAVLSVLMLAMPVFRMSKTSRDKSYDANCIIVESSFKQPMWRLALLTFIAGVSLLFIMHKFPYLKLIFLLDITKVLLLVGPTFSLMILLTDCFTSTSSYPVKDTVNKTKEMGAAINILSCYQYGMLSVFCLLGLMTFVTYVCIKLQIPTALLVLTLASMSPVIIYLDQVGPSADNSGTISSMTESWEAREVSDILDSAGNTTKSLTKGHISGVIALCTLVGIINFSFAKVNNMQIIYFVLGVLFAIFIAFVCTIATISAAQKTFKISEQAISSCPDVKCAKSIYQIKYSYYASVAQKIINYSCLITPWTIILFAITLRLQSGMHGIGLSLTALIFSVLTSTWGAMADNVKKVLESSAGELEELEKKLAGIVAQQRLIDPEFSLDNLDQSYVGNNPTQIHLGEILKLKTDRDQIKMAIDASVTSDVIGDPHKDVSGPVLSIVCIMGICCLLNVLSWSNVQTIVKVVSKGVA